jgi:choloylglycine hydrolase
VLFPCSIFTYKIGPSVFFCGNEDWTAKDPAIITIKPKNNEYGVLLFGWDSYLPNYPQAGVNSEGLCFDWATVPGQKFFPINGKSNLDINDTITILKNCKNINEAIEYINKYNFPHIAEEHLILTDKTGSSCVIEYTKGKQQIIRSNSTQYITNFNLTDKEAGWYPCKRYDTLANTLSSSKLQINDLVKALDAVHQEGTYQTIYSYIINLSSMTINIFYNHDYSKNKEILIKDILEKDQRIKIK